MLGHFGRCHQWLAQTNGPPIAEKIWGV